MALKRYLRPSNLRVRLVVGLALAVVFCLQCSQTQANRSSQFVTAVGGNSVGEQPGAVVNELERLARTDHVALLKKALEHCQQNYQDYTCTFIKQERVNGQLGPEQWIDVKFMEKPFSVAMHWVKNAPLGDRMLYVDGKYNNQMLIQPKGALVLLTGGAVVRDPVGKEAMANTLRPVTMFGFRNTLANLLMVYERATRRGESQTRFVGYGDVAGHRALVLERVLPQKNNYPAKLTLWYLDVERLVPLGMKAYDWDDQLICSYLYKDVKLNLGLGEKDFIPEANDIKVKK